jgi:putative Mg2+ transporter-C (MgtC) family protein
MHLSAEWQSALRDIGRLLVAYLLAVPVGWQREQEAHSVGVRTFPLVAMASCGYVLLAMPGHASFDAQSRVIQGLVAGIGFIGGGAILKAGRNVHGTAAAASIWNVGVVGAAVAQDRYLLAFVLAAMNLVALRVLLPLKAKLDAANAQEAERGREPR